MKRLENKTAVITGGNSGMGKATAKLFAREGAKVAITGRTPKTLEAAIEEIGHNAIFVENDVSDLSSLTASFKKIQDELGNFDVLVVNAGVSISGDLSEFTEDDFDKMSSINFKGTFFTVQKALPYLNDGASIILTSSSSNQKGAEGFSAYSATKAAVRSFARSFSAELLDRNIRVNALSPGAIDTPMFEQENKTEGEKSDAIKEMVPAQRLGTVDEIAEAFLFLASDASKYMIGSELVMDGGAKTL